MTLAPFERLPPHDIEAEEAVIAALMVDAQAILAVHPILKPHDFFREKNGWIFEACVALWNRDEAINQITVAHELSGR
ncbi:MAG: DnaB-like helicase N-terminal domain-containing protein, partial [Tepidiformaceae bacterium]